MGSDYADGGWAWKSAFEPLQQFRRMQSADDAGLRGNVAPWPKERRNPVVCHYREDHNLLTELRSPERRGKQAIITNAPYVKVTANPVFQILELYNFMP